MVASIVWSRSNVVASIDFSSKRAKVYDAWKADARMPCALRENKSKIRFDRIWAARTYCITCRRTADTDARYQVQGLEWRNAGRSTGEERDGGRMVSGTVSWTSFYIDWQLRDCNTPSFMREWDSSYHLPRVGDVRRELSREPTNGYCTLSPACRTTTTDGRVIDMLGALSVPDTWTTCARDAPRYRRAVLSSGLPLHREITGTQLTRRRF